MATPPPAAAAPPAFWWFRHGPAATDLLLVDAGLFTTAGQLAPSSWFARVFGGQFQRPPALGSHEGLPVYGTDIPGPILREMLHGMRFGALLDDMYQSVPVSLVNTVEHATWRAYLEYYVLGARVPVDVVDSSDEGERPRKRPRSDDTGDNPYFAHIRRVATALAAKIRAEHPGWAAFAAGATRFFTCWFVSTFRLGTPDGTHTYLLPLEGEPVVPPVVVARTLMGLAYGTKLDVFIPALLAGLDLPAIVHLETHRSHKSKAKIPDMAQDWPVGRVGQPVRLTPGHHDIVDLTVAYRM